MVGIAAAIGMVAAGRDLALVVEQPVEDMRGFAGGRRNKVRQAAALPKLYRRRLFRSGIRGAN